MSNDSALLSAEELQSNGDKIRHLAAKQLLNLFHAHQNRDKDPFYWGDEIECLLLHLDHSSSSVRLEHAPWQKLEEVQKVEPQAPSLQPELGTFMLETTPSKPFGDSLLDLLSWKDDFARRRKLVNDTLPSGSALVTLPYFPRYGAGSSGTTAQNPLGNKNELTGSALVPDTHIASVDRYKSILRNIVQKRGRKVEIHVPLFHDERTSWSEGHNSIFMDSTLFGATGCSLQVTMQARNLDQARRLHDTLTPLAPMLLAMTAGTPVFRGMLADTDTRWACFEQAVDDRGQHELQAKKPSRSRVSTSTTYVAAAAPHEYQLKNLDHDPGIKQILTDGGMDDSLALHFAYLLSRDPLFASREEIEAADEKSTATCQGLLANMYSIIRLKPPSDEKTGWLVEFRPMESQVRDFENASFCVLVVLLARLILDTEIDLYVPLEEVESSMRLACRRDAAIHEKFAFRGSSVASGVRHNDWLNTNEIMNGMDKEGGFEGIIPLVKQHLKQMDGIDDSHRRSFEPYLDFISERASGRNQTTARWMREFIRQHKDYHRDSLVSDLITHDLIKACVDRSTADAIN